MAGWLDALLPVPLADVLEREAAEHEALRALLDGRMIAMTLNRSAGRIEDELWGAFLAKARAEGLTNTNAMRRMIRQWTGMLEPVRLSDTGSGTDQVAAS
jgi:hypothetical protein